MMLHGVRGHLATITSNEENRWIMENTGVGEDQVWIGGIQEVPNGGPDSDWRWITGEPWEFTNWNSGEPNDAGEDEFYLIIWDPSGTWNDELSDSNQPGYVVEFPFSSPPEAANIPSKRLFRRAMEVMNGLESFRMEGYFVEKHPRGEFEMSFEGERSGESAKLTELSRDKDHESRYERILVPPYVYISDDQEEGAWYRQPMEGPESLGSSMLDAGVYIFPHPEIPLRFYELTPLGIEDIGDVEANHIRLNADWRCIARWLKNEGSLGEAAARAAGYNLEGFLERYANQPRQDFEVWIDEDGFLRKMTIESSWDGGARYGEFHYFDFNEPVLIQPPDRFEEIAADEPAPILSPEPSPTPASNPPPEPSPTPVARNRVKRSFGPTIEIGYNNSLHLCGCDRKFEEQWEPGRWLYEIRWEYYTEYPVALSATFDRPLNPRDGDRRSSFKEESGLYTYSWKPDRGRHLSLEPRVVADSGILLRRSITPNTLPPGTTKAVIRASFKLLRSPTVHDIPVRPVGGNMWIDINEDNGNRYEGMERIRVVSVSEDKWRDIGPFLEEGREYMITVEAVLENPNPFPVSYLPAVGVEVRLDPDSEAMPFEVSLPKGFETSSADVSFEAVGIGGEWVSFTFSNRSNENSSWIFEGKLKGINHWWQSAVQPVR